MNKYKYLQFYDKNGNNLNLDYDSTLGLWVGSVYVPKVSVDLIESCQIFIAEEFKTGPTAEISYGLPHIYGSTGSTSTVNVYWENDKTPEFFIYSFDPTEEKILLQKAEQQVLSFDQDVTETIAATGSTGIKYTSIITSTVSSINIGFCPKSEISYENILNLKDNNSGEIFAKITFYGEGLEEDKRLGVMLDNLGWNITNSDFKIFQSTDIKEDLPNTKKLNEKRKELLLEFENIFTYLGSYKALINIIKYFGYDNVKLKEYWLNVDIESTNFGKYRHTDIIDLFSGDGDPNVSEKFIPNKFYKKTSKFGLFYNITEWDGGYDEDGLPTVIESNQFTLEEVLIKLYALKQKLKSHFLPLNARIVDIVGEALYFTKYDINVWTDQTRIDNIDLNIRPKVEILPSDFGYIQDLRPIQHLGCPIAPDLIIGGTHELAVYNYTINEADEGDKFIIRDTITNNKIEYTTQYLETDAETLIGLVDAWNSSNNYPFINFQVYPFGVTANGIMRVVEQYKTDYNFEIEVIPGPVAGTPTLVIDQLFMGASVISEYSDCFIGYFQGAQIEVNELNDDIEIPVGYPIVLKNNSLEIPFDDMELTWNSIDDIEITSGASNYGYPLYGPYINSFISISATGPSGSTYSTIDEDQFPFSIYNTTGNGVYNWNNIGYCNFYESRWKITCTESNTTGATTWVHDTGYQPLTTVLNYPLILPYEGKYRLEMWMNDLYNGRTYLKTENAIEVNVKTPNIIAWYESRNEEYSWDDKISNDNTKILDWTNYNSTWDLPVHENEEINLGEMSYEFLDKLEFYQQQYDKTPKDNKVSIDPYIWNNLGNTSVWSDFKSLYWNYCNPELLKFRILDITSTTPELSIFNEITGKKSTFSFSDIGSTGSTGFLQMVKQLNTFAGSSAINTGTIGLTNTNTTNLFETFIFYYDEKYENAFGATHPHQKIPYITAVSKDIGVPRTIKLEYTGLNGDPYAQKHSILGTVGDIPTGFEIYTFSAGATFQLDETPIYTIGPTTTNLQELCSELNSSLADGISDYTYNIVSFYTGGTHSGVTAGNTGATGMLFDHYVKIIATNKGFTSNTPLNIKYSGNIIGTSYGRSITTNPQWDTLRPIKYSSKVNNLSRVNFTYDNSKFSGGKNPIWKIIKENDSNWVDIYYRNEYLSYLFNEKGSYSIELILDDTNGNKSKISKKEFIKII